MTFPILGGNSAVAGYSIDNSLRFNSGDSPILARTPSSAGDGQKFTYSTWFKRSEFGVEMSPFLHSGSNASNYFRLNLSSGDAISSFSISGGSTDFEYVTTQVFRDPSAWYHLVFAVDTTNGTAENRVRFYINGSEITSFSSGTNPNQNLLTDVNGTTTHYIGRRTPGNDSFYDGYLAETQLVDGQQLSPTDFGEFDEDSGIWKPKEYEGTYGTNGFYLDFENSGSLGADQSGNSNNFTPTNLASTDQTTDTPTNNFATWNVLNKNSNITTSEGNNRLNATGSWGNIIGSIGAKNSGKWYWEVYFVSGTAGRLVGIANPEFNTSSTSTPIGIDTAGFSWGYQGGGNKYHENVSPAYGDSFGAGDIIGVALDLDGGNLTFYKNNTSQGVAYSSLPDLYYLPALSLANTEVAVINCGQDGSFAGNLTAQGNADGNGYGDFYYAPPSGYLALCTQNLATALSPTIDDGSQYFNTVLYTGNHPTGQSITGVGFQPDWVWGKGRSHAQASRLFDSTRGALNNIISSATNAEQSLAGSLTSFDSDGFTLGSEDSINYNARTFVAWNWKANGGITSSNTDGSITSTVQANTTAGFSIVTYTGTGANGTIGHGLGKAPAMIITKTRDNADNWGVYHQGMDATAPQDYYIPLNLTNAKINVATTWNDTAPTSSVFSVGTNGVSNDTGGMVAYCFAEIEGYSKFGSYTGNGSTDGTFVYTGFRPAFLIVKNTSITSEWMMWDNKRDTFNVVDARIYPNRSYAEGTGVIGDFLSNGVKIRNSGGWENGNGNKIIYMAFAENPFVTSTGIAGTAK